MMKNVAVPVSVLKGGDAQELSQYGLQQMPLEDIANINEAKNAVAEANQRVGYRVERMAAYPPIGDQLDAILKALNQLQLGGINLPAETDAIIGKWLAVKRDIPKPEA